MNPERCRGCGSVFPYINGPVHAYIDSSAGCWAAYGDVLAREYSNPEYMKVHRLTVDAYAIQHPGTASRRSTQSVAVHLIALHLVLELGRTTQQATQAIRRAVESSAFSWLEPPKSRGTLTIATVLPAASAEQHTNLVSAWARDAWAAWSNHHDQVRQWAAVTQAS